MTSFILYAFLGVVLLFLAMPTSVTLRLARLRQDDSPAVELDCGFFTGLTGFSLGISGNRWVSPILFGRKFRFLRLNLGRKDTRKSGAARAQIAPTSAAAPEKAIEKEKKESSGVERLRRSMPILRLVAQPAFSFLTALPRSIVTHRLHLSGKLGLDDPAQTGQICGLIHGLNLFKNKFFRLSMEPDFATPGVTGRLDFGLRIYLGYFVWLTFLLVSRVASKWVWLKFAAVAARFIPKENR